MICVFVLPRFGFYFSIFGRFLANLLHFFALLCTFLLHTIYFLIFDRTFYYRGSDNHLKTLFINPRLCHNQTPVFNHLFTISSPTKSSPEFVGLPAELEGYTVEMVLGYLHGYSFAVTQPDKLNYYFITACYFGLDGLKNEIRKFSCTQNMDTSVDFSGMFEFSKILAKPESYGDGVCTTVEDLPRVKS